MTPLMALLRLASYALSLAVGSGLVVAWGRRVMHWFFD